MSLLWKAIEFDKKKKTTKNKDFLYFLTGNIVSD